MFCLIWPNSKESEIKESTPASPFTSLDCISALTLRFHFLVVSIATNIFPIRHHSFFLESFSDTLEAGQCQQRDWCLLALDTLESEHNPLGEIRKHLKS